jgi:hypothetical protein
VIAEDEQQEKSYLLIHQFCKELDLDYYFELIKSKGMTSKMFLKATFPALLAAYKEIDPEHIALLYLKAQAHNERKKFYLNIKDRCIRMEKEAREVTHDVERAMAAGKLTLKEIDGEKYWIEDAEGGNGLCILQTKDNEYMYSRRMEWQTHGFPGQWSNDEGNSFYVYAYS